MEKHANILYMQSPCDDNAGHFAYIKDLSRLVSSQINKKEHKKYFCDRCLHYFSSSEKLQSNTTDCEKKQCAIRLPSEDDKWLEFKNHTNKERLPFVIYTDLECVLWRTEPAEKEDASYTYQQHEIFSIGYYVRSLYDDVLSVYRFRCGEDCVAFVRQLEDLAHQVKILLFGECPYKNVVERTVGGIS
ncbi:uncharacterized protein LOC112552597 [Pogonomyrmex barbatus]|uniref:Uncharacterized protein LOC112552597 n=1 Tax=Pogonomyrmex barbatus TaxID=144034 RepID=A0A8N1S597_9HYME|nr:uncharacterized protein LOC112552597 [Pogonomyrmex barbatus]